MKWKIELTDEYEQWWEELSEEEQDSIMMSIGLLS